MNEQSGRAASSIVDAARADVRNLAERKLWTPEMTAELGRVFERSAAQALRAPRYSERSLVLRRVARLLVPRRARRYLRRALAIVERPLDVLAARRDR
ncbi:MAG: hypothetical protein ABSB55_01600 [Acidimicrobiales bacterium]